MRIRGEWPNPVALRQGWARATARPWNRHRTDAHLRLIRGSSSFLASAADTVLELGATAVVSPPLMAGAQRPWRVAGFDRYLGLTLLSNELNGELPVEADVRRLGDSSWARVVGIDAAAFGDQWRAELPALVEAMKSTSQSLLLGAEEPEAAILVGYVIVAASSGSGYVQRLAVHPHFQGHGYGRALTRAAQNWARRRGARTMLLNTKPDNHGALALYQSEGYVVLPQRLELLQYPGEVG